MSFTSVNPNSRERKSHPVLVAQMKTRRRMMMKRRRKMMTTTMMMILMIQSLMKRKGSLDLHQKGRTACYSHIYSSMSYVYQIAAELENLKL